MPSARRYCLKWAAFRQLKADGEPKRVANVRFPPKADISLVRWDVCFVPKADITGLLGRRERAPTIGLSIVPLDIKVRIFQ